MPPKVSRTRTSYQLAPISSLDALLVLPVPAPAPLKRSIWMGFLNDLSFMLPAFGIVFGFLFLFGQSPFLGAGMVTLCPIILALRIHVAFQARRERRRVKKLINWHRQYRSDYGRYRVDYVRRPKRVVNELPDVIYCPVPPAKRMG